MIPLSVKHQTITTFAPAPLPKETRPSIHVSAPPRPKFIISARSKTTKRLLACPFVGRGA